MIVKVLVEQSITVPDDATNDEVDQVIHSLARHVTIQEQHSLATLIGIRIGSGPTDLRSSIEMLRGWFPTRTGGQ